MFFRKKSKGAAIEAEKSGEGACSIGGAIRKNVAGLSDSLRDISNNEARIAADFMTDTAESMKATGMGAIEKIEKRIRLNPGQSIGIAFAAGLVASFFIGRRVS